MIASTADWMTSPAPSAMMLAPNSRPVSAFATSLNSAVVSPLTSARGDRLKRQDAGLHLQALGPLTTGLLLGEASQRDLRAGEDDLGQVCEVQAPSVALQGILGGDRVAAGGDIDELRLDDHVARGEDRRDARALVLINHGRATEVRLDTCRIQSQTLVLGCRPVASRISSTRTSTRSDPASSNPTPLAPITSTAPSTTASPTRASRRCSNWPTRCSPTPPSTPRRWAAAPRRAGREPGAGNAARRRRALAAVSS